MTVQHSQGENCHVYCHSRRDGAEGVTYLVINNSPTDPLDVVLPGDAMRYTLHARSLRSPVMLLNGQELTLPDTGDIPELGSPAAASGDCPAGARQLHLLCPVTPYTTQKSRGEVSPLLFHFNMDCRIPDYRKSRQDTSRSIFFHWVSSSTQLPSSTDANPHWGERAMFVAYNCLGLLIPGLEIVVVLQLCLL